MGEVKKLDWDSSFFGLNVGRVDLGSKSELDFLNRNNDFELIYVFSDNDNLFKGSPAFIDNRVVFAKTPSNDYDVDPNVKIYQGPCNRDLEQLAILSGHHSRFKKDIRLKPFFEKLYLEWIRASVDKRIADVIFVYEIDGIISGFVSAQKRSQIIQIGLISVSQAHWGKGIGTALLNAVCFHFKGQIIEVVTQSDNRGACALYFKNGFNICASNYIYHIWK